MAGKFGPYDIRPPASTSPLLTIAGGRALTAKSTIRCECSPKIRAGHHDQSICALLHDRQERRLNIVSGLHLCWNETEVQGPSRPFDLSKLRAGGREARIPEDAHAFGIRNGRDQQFQPFRGEIAHLNAYPSEIPARSRQRGNKAGTNRVAGP